jgi:hypothetical protein
MLAERFRQKNFFLPYTDAPDRRLYCITRIRGRI